MYSIRQSWEWLAVNAELRVWGCTVLCSVTLSHDLLLSGSRSCSQEREVCAINKRRHDCVRGGREVVRRVTLAPRSSRVRGSILSSGFHLRGRLHILTVPKWIPFTSSGFLPIRNIAKKHSGRWTDYVRWLHGAPWRHSVRLAAYALDSNQSIVLYEQLQE